MFALGGRRDEWRAVPMRRLPTYLSAIARLQARRDLVLIDATSYPHWSGPKGDKHRGDRLRREYRERLVGRLNIGRDGYNASGVPMITHDMGATLRAWFADAGFAGIEA